MHSTISMDCHKADMFWYCTAAGWHAKQCAGCGACCSALLRPTDCSAMCTFSLLAFFDGLSTGSSMEVK